MKNLLTILVVLFSIGAFAQESTVGPPIGPPPEKEPLCALRIVQPCEGSEDAINRFEYTVEACKRYADVSAKVITEYLCQYGVFPDGVTLLDKSEKNPGILIRP
ncbi:hypothetical protein LNQ81_12885 [Myroides sp. M-43]|uniref:hypothetical protein n=1 Tax=Myroides oncorhynchi TaxID=2893756 RepID=UPI001E3847DE|nr:hypothetical protein [Myroides oncorhynchi]MCC9043569.1 hypothetical protein [Myroides oncorhynchi]